MQPLILDFAARLVRETMNLVERMQREYPECAAFVSQPVSSEDGKTIEVKVWACPTLEEARALAASLHQDGHTPAVWERAASSGA